VFWLLAKVLRIFFKIQIHRWLRIDPRSRQAWWQKVLWQSWGARVWEKDDQTVWYCRIHGLQRLHPRYSKIRCTFADFKRWFNFFRSSNVPPFKITRLVNFRQPISHLQKRLGSNEKTGNFWVSFPEFFMRHRTFPHGLSRNDYDQDNQGKEANSYSLGSPRKAVADNVCLVRPVTGRLFSTLKISSY